MCLNLVLFRLFQAFGYTPCQFALRKFSSRLRIAPAETPKHKVEKAFDSVRQRRNEDFNVVALFDDSLKQFIEKLLTCRRRRQ